MLQALAAKWQIDLSASVMIGDRETDLEAGKRAGCISLQLTSETDLPSLVSEAIKIIDTEK
jgi:D-glycero-D-manno-heptose 1,7-bisphosphate phosphatase